MSAHRSPQILDTEPLSVTCLQNLTHVIPVCLSVHRPNLKRLQSYQDADLSTNL